MQAEISLDHDNPLTKWFLQHYGIAVRIAFSFAPDRDAVNDIVQSAFVEFVQQADAGTDDADRAAALKKVTRRVSQKIWNDRYRDKPEKLRQIAERLADLAEQHFAEREFEDELLALQSCLAKLPEKSRKLIEEHYFMGNSVGTISRRFNVTPAAVYKAIGLIRNKLKDCIRYIQGKGGCHAN